MLSNVITLVINLLSAIQWIEKDEELQRKILEIVRDQIDLVLKPKPKIDSVRFLYETDGKVAAIRRWREINDGMGLKDAKDAVENAAKEFEWKDYKIGKMATVTNGGSDYYQVTGRITKASTDGYFVRLHNHSTDLYFRQNELNIHM
jgi:hypothetical protein